MMAWSLTYSQTFQSVKLSGPYAASLWTKLVEVMESQLSYFKYWKMMPLKCCTQYGNTYGKLSSGHRPGKVQFSFQSQRKAIPKNAQTTTQLHSFHTLAQWCSKFSKLSFNSTWTENLQMFKLCSAKAEEPEVKLLTSVGSYKARKLQKNIYFCFIDCDKAFDCGSQRTVENS